MTEQSEPPSAVSQHLPSSGALHCVCRERVLYDFLIHTRFWGMLALRQIFHSQVVIYAPVVQRV